MNLSDKVALVTGSTSGIGLGIARALESVEPVDQDRRPGDDSFDRAGIDVVDDRLVADLRVDPPEMRGAGVRLGQRLRGILLVVRALPLEVHPVHEVSIEQAQRAHTGAREEFRGRAAESTQARTMRLASQSQEAK